MRLVGAPEKRVRNGKAERLSGFKIDDQFKLGCLHDWQFGRISATPPSRLMNSRRLIASPPRTGHRNNPNLNSGRG